MDAKIFVICMLLSVFDAHYSTPVSGSKKSSHLPVIANVYFDSLCPDCKKFITEQLYPTYNKLKSSGILKINLFPYGNTAEYNNGITTLFTCRYGIAECEANMLYACAVDKLKQDALPFINCMTYHGPYEANTAFCAQENGIDIQRVAQCAKGTKGIEVMHKFGKKTEQVMPHEKNVYKTIPLLIVDWKFVDAKSDMLEYVCNQYRGPKPEACIKPVKKHHVHKSQ